LNQRLNVPTHSNAVTGEETGNDRAAGNEVERASHLRIRQDSRLEKFSRRDLAPVARLVDRGDPGNRTCDIGSMELYAASVIASDPFVVAAALRQAAAR
jgi:hypothetical protein